MKGGVFRQEWVVGVVGKLRSEGEPGANQRKGAALFARAWCGSRNGLKIACENVNYLVVIIW